ncbi:hypothetical protein ACQP1G_38210 [Nocardia sp. CA-107356]|uniref:hypothetical protein n=1 Tax=Nocardia sp. CA-107356 TaxID=3239972 RepID=UPI003D945ACE
MVCVPLNLAGETLAPLAAMVGTDRDRPEFLVVAQPRDKDLRLRFAHQLALPILDYIAACRHSRPRRTAHAVAPQLWVPNRGGIEFLGLLSRAIRFRSTTGSHSVPIPVPTLGRWLKFLADRADHPGSALLLAATDVLGQHWATGQSAMEDGNLAALLGWIDPPAGRDGPQAALEAEDPLTWPPAGPATDPLFDREALVGIFRDYDHARTDRDRRTARARLETAVRGQIEPTWELVWRAIDLMRALPAGDRVGTRWARDVKAFQKTDDYIAGDGPPQPKHPNPVNSAREINWLERAKAEYDAQRAFDDPLVMAEFRLAGEAFAGTVTAVEIDPRSRRSPQATITITTNDPVRLIAETTGLRDHHRPQQKGTITAVDSGPDQTRITLRLSKGMGNNSIPIPGSVPKVNDHVCYTLLSDRYTPTGKFPEPSMTPWTHGGPPPPQIPADGAEEEWA